MQLRVLEHVIRESSDAADESAAPKQLDDLDDITLVASKTIRLSTSKGSTEIPVTTTKSPERVRRARAIRQVDEPIVFVENPTVTLEIVPDLTLVLAPDTSEKTPPEPVYMPVTSNLKLVKSIDNPEAAGQPHIAECAEMKALFASPQFRANALGEADAELEVQPDALEDDLSEACMMMPTEYEGIQTAKVIHAEGVVVGHLAEHSPDFSDAKQEQVVQLFDAMPEAMQLSLADLFERSTESTEEVEQYVVAIAEIADRLYELASTGRLDSEEALQIQEVLSGMYCKLAELLGVELDDEMIEAFIAAVKNESYRSVREDQAETVAASKVALRSSVLNTVSQNLFDRFHDVSYKIGRYIVQASASLPL